MFFLEVIADAIKVLLRGTSKVVGRVEKSLMCIMKVFMDKTRIINILSYRKNISKRFVVSSKTIGWIRFISNVLMLRNHGIKVLALMSPQCCRFMYFCSFLQLLIPWLNSRNIVYVILFLQSHDTWRFVLLMDHAQAFHTSPKEWTWKKPPSFVRRVLTFYFVHQGTYAL